MQLSLEHGDFLLLFLRLFEFLHQLLHQILIFTVLFINKPSQNIVLLFLLFKGVIHLIYLRNESIILDAEVVELGLTVNYFLLEPLDFVHGIAGQGKGIG